MTGELVPITDLVQVEHFFIVWVSQKSKKCSKDLLKKGFPKVIPPLKSKSDQGSVRGGFICEIINKRANTCDPTIEEYVYSSRSSMIWCLGLVWSACAYSRDRDIEGSC